ncbi:MAG TPA: hypothetical protein VNJ51_14655 [Candidatus Dormibacteraeota bacterium]|nr:hypothetical protein [Candidatus Dormibacteraeota bacterium]
MHEVAKLALDIAYYEVAYRDESVIEALLTFARASDDDAERYYRSEVRPRIARALVRRRRDIVRAARASCASACAL